MQNLDFTMIHVPGKENVTDYMSRHPLPETNKDNIEKRDKEATQVDHVILLEQIAAETKMDQKMQHLRNAMQSGRWDKKDPVLQSYTDL